MRGCWVSVTEYMLQVLDDLEVGNVPQLVVWNKVDAVAQPDVVQAVAEERDNTVCVSAQTGQVGFACQYLMLCTRPVKTL